MSIKHYKDICGRCKKFDRFILKIICSDNEITPILPVGTCKDTECDHYGHMLTVDHSSCKRIEK